MPRKSVIQKINKQMYCTRAVLYHAQLSMRYHAERDIASP